MNLENKAGLGSLIVALERQPGSKGSVVAGAVANRALALKFRARLERLVDEEGLSEDIGMVNPAMSLPIIRLQGSKRLAERIRLMDGVQSVALDSAFDLPVGEFKSLWSDKN